MTEQLNALYDAVVANLDDTYDLVYVSQGDRLQDEQVTALVAGDWETVFDLSSEWESDNQHSSAEYHAEEETKAIIQQWAIRDDRDYDGLFDEFKDSEHWDALTEKIRERDGSDWVRDLARGNGTVLMRTVIFGEDDAFSYEKVTPTAVIERLLEHAEPGTVLKRNAHNLAKVREVLAECSPEYGFLMGMLVYAVPVADFVDLSHDTEYVDIVDPHLYLGNYYAGDGYCEGPLRGTFRIKRSDLTTDEGAAGYGWNEVAGVVTSYYETTMTAVPVVEKESA